MSEWHRKLLQTATNDEKEIKSLCQELHETRRQQESALNKTLRDLEYNELRLTLQHQVVEHYRTELNASQASQGK